MMFEGVTATDDSQVANLFASFFRSVYVNFPILDPVPSTESNNHSYFLVSQLHIQELLNKLHINKSSSPDNLPNIFLRNTTATISKPLHNFQFYINYKF